MTTAITALLNYSNEAVIERFLKHHPAAKEEADLIFKDLLRFLWLEASYQAKRRTDSATPDISFSASMYIIDEMWHAFILLSEAYHEFCAEYFGKYLHHPTPMPKFESNQRAQGEEKAMEIFLTEMISAVHEKFGEETALRWFDDYLKYAEAR